MSASLITWRSVNRMVPKFHSVILKYLNHTPIQEYAGAPKRSNNNLEHWWTEDDQLLYMRNAFANKCFELCSKQLKFLLLI